MTEKLKGRGGSRSSANAQWYYGSGDERVRPISARELKDLADAGEITPETLVWKKGLKEWVPVRKVRGLFLAEPADAPAADDPLAELSRGTALRECPFCAELIKREARKCRFCGELLPSGIQIACPSCKEPLPPGIQSCMACGYDFGTGQRATAAQLQPTRHPSSRRPLGMHKQRIAVLSAAAGGMLGTFLPWVHAPIVGAVYGTTGLGDGWITLALFAGTLILSLLGHKQESLAGGSLWGVVIPSGIASLSGILNIVNINSSLSDAATGGLFGTALSQSVQIGVGLYLIVVAGIAVGILAFALKGRVVEGDRPTVGGAGNA